jgi:hypothetical protein
MADKSEAPVAPLRAPGPGNRSAIAAGNPSVARRTARRHGGTYAVTPSAGAAFSITVSGRDRWALEQLRRAGPTGCTPADAPAPRWSAYVHKLRKLGLEIVTLQERHGGDFPGGHGRYVLRSAVTRRQEGGGDAH